MALWELFMIAVGLSMDAFAVSICKGLSVPQMKYRHCLIAGLYFGGFQGLMPLGGYLLGTGFSDIIERFDHWIAFILLGIIGAVIGVRLSKEKQIWATMMDAEKDNIEGKAKALNDTIQTMKGDVRKVYETIGQFLGQFHVHCEVGEYQSKLYALKLQAQNYIRLKEKLKVYDKERAACKEQRAKLEAFVKQYQFELGTDEAYALNNLQTKATEYQMAENAYKAVFAKRQVFEQQQEKSFWTKQAFCPYSLDELNTWIAECDAKLEELKLTKSQYAKQMDSLQEQLDLRDEKEEELLELHLAQEKDLHKYNLLKVTQGFLQQAKEQFMARYMEPIAKGFSKYYGMLTGDVSENWMIDANINLRIKEKGELRDIHCLSAGYQDLIGVCMRLALVDAMYQEEKPSMRNLPEHRILIQ